MMNQDTIPLEILLDEEGHLSDVAVTTLGDGQSALVPAAVLQHAESCAACCQRMGDAALISADIEEIVRDAMPIRELAKPQSARSARAFPVTMVAAAMVVASVGLVPTLYRAPAWFRETVTLLSHLIPVMAKSGYLILKRGGLGSGPLVAVLPFASAVVLMALGFVMAKRLPRAVMAERGVLR